MLWSAILERGSLSCHKLVAERQGKEVSGKRWPLGQ